MSSSSSFMLFLDSTAIKTVLVILHFKLYSLCPERQYKDSLHYPQGHLVLHGDTSRNINLLEWDAVFAKLGELSLMKLAVSPADVEPAPNPGLHQEIKLLAKNMNSLGYYVSLQK